MRKKFISFFLENILFFIVVILVLFLIYFQNPAIQQSNTKDDAIKSSKQFASYLLQINYPDNYATTMPRLITGEAVKKMQPKIAYGTNDIELALNKGRIPRQYEYALYAYINNKDNLIIIDDNIINENTYYFEFAYTANKAPVSMPNGEPISCEIYTNFIYSKDKDILHRLASIPIIRMYTGSYGDRGKWQIYNFKCPYSIHDFFVEALNSKPN